MKNWMKIGMRIVGLPSADEEYGTTAPKNGFIGKIIDIDPYDEFDDLYVKVVASKDPDEIGEEYWVDSDFFAPEKDNRVTKYKLDGGSDE